MRNEYELLRDPQRQPKCYEMTEQERLEAVKRTEQLLQEHTVKKKHSPQAVHKLTAMGSSLL